mmetsp:Transcript_36891/g.104114  ORF Transcript_36891/g.104114 Transcript_36891/m.104114 type:complete len:396 (+) Transcript_36891:523-1710(+)
MASSWLLELPRWDAGLTRYAGKQFPVYVQGQSRPFPAPPCPTAPGPATVLNGRQIAAEWLAELEHEVSSVSGVMGRPPKLRVVMVGDRPDSRVYVHRKLQRCHEVGIDADVHLLPTTASQADLESVVSDANESEDVDAILVQLPLPDHMDEGAVMTLLHPDKDVDGFHPLNMGSLLMKGRNTRLVPCTALGCLELLKRSGMVVRGKQVVVVGDSNIVGAPLSIGLLREHGAAAVTVCNRTARQSTQAGAELRAMEDSAASAPHNSAHSYVEMGFPMDLPEITGKADILVVAVGCKGLVRRNWVKPGAVVLDVGINVSEEASGLPHSSFSGSHEIRGVLHVAGDVAFDEVSYVASALTPVPCGVGPMTIAAVVHNTVRAAKFRHGLLYTSHQAPLG